MATRLGVAYVELDMDFTPFRKAQTTIVNESKEAGKTIEENFKRIGVTSDNMYQAMANRAVKAYEAITAAGTKSADELFRAQSAVVAKVNTLNSQMNKNPLYETLGIKSVAAIEAQKAAIISSYDTIKKSGTASAQDLINIERAKNAKLKELNKEMVGEHSMSMAAMTRSVLRFYAAWYVASTAVIGIKDLFMGGVKAIDDLKTSTIAVAAQITNMQGTSGNIVENYRNNLAYAEALNVKMMEIDANSFANYNQIILMNRAMNQHGVILDINKQKQIEAFTALTNTIALLTTGQNQELQASQEMNALMTGEIKTTNRVAQMIDSLINKQGDYKKGLKELVAEGEKHGDTLERLQPYLVGVAAAAGDISKTWMAVGSSIETTWGALQREVFAGFYQGLVTVGQEASAWIKQNAEEIGRYIKIVLNSVGDIIGSIWNVLKGFAPIFIDLARLTAPIAYGWGGVFAAMKPIGEFLGNSIKLTYDLIKLIGNAAATAGLFATGQFNLASVQWGATKKIYGDIENLSTSNKKILTTGIADAIVAYDKQFQAAKKANSTFSLPSIPAGKIGDESAKAAKAVQREEEQILAALTKQNKTHYDTVVQNAKSAAELKIKQGENVLGANTELYNKEQDALNDWYNKQAVYINRSFDSEKVKQEKLETLYDEYSKKWDANQNDKLKKEEDYTQKHIAIMAEAYKTINQYSDESINAEIANIERKRRSDTGYAQKGSQDEVVLLEASTKKIEDIYSRRNAASLSLYEKTKIYAANATEIIEDLAIDEYNKAIDLTNDEMVAEKAYTDFVRDESIKRLKISEDENDGIKAYLLERQRDYLTMAQAGYNIIKQEVEGFQSTLSDVLFDGMKGDMKSFQEYWDKFADALLRKFTDTIAQMAVEWALGISQTGGSGSGFLSLLSGVAGLVNSGVGIASSLASTASAASSAAYIASAYSSLASLSSSGYAMLYHNGGVVGESSVPTRVMPAMSWASVPRYHNGLLSDEFPAVLQKGETVLPRGKSASGGSTAISINIVAADAKSFEDMCKRNPGAIINPITNALQNNRINKQWKGLLQ